MSQTTIVSASIPSSQADAIDAIASTGEYMNRSDVVREAIREYLRRRPKVQEDHGKR